jgi:electron transfer flavoprotein alpha/beta subunit
VTDNEATARLTITPGSRIMLWLGNQAPARSIRWLDGALKTAAKFDPNKTGRAIAFAAGGASWLDLVADRARHAGIASAGVTTDLQLDYLGWAQIVAAAARQLGAGTILVDEASRPERWVEVAAIAELLDAAQLTHVVKLAPDKDVIHASRVTGRQLQTVRVRGTAVLGVRIAGAPIDEYPTPMPSTSMQRLQLEMLGVDPLVLGHRSQPPRSHEPKRTVERIAEHLVVHLAPRLGDGAGA